MKKITKQLLIFSLFFSVANCQKTNNNQPTEVRFVDLQGKPKPIKTRIPEANAKIMSGQINHNENIDVAANLGKNKTADLGLESYKKNFVNSSNSQNKISVIEKEADSDGEQVVEYDLDSENNAKKISKADYQSQETELSQENSSSKNIQKNDNSEIFEEDLQNSKANKNSFTQNLYKNNISNLEEDEQDGKIITYSAKKYKKTLTKNAKKITVQDSEEIDNSQSEDFVPTNYKNKSNKITKIAKSSKYSTGSKGKYYVQVGAFNNSAGARERLNLVTNQKNGKVIIANINERRIYRSVFGPYSSRNQALKVKKSIENNGNEAIIIKN